MGVREVICTAVSVEFNAVPESHIGTAKIERVREIERELHKKRRACHLYTMFVIVCESGR